ncbi:MAG: hypothetical protein AAGF23_00115 [Acidobacteriota bacterium]
MGHLLDPSLWLPDACAWAEWQEQRSLAAGRPLDRRELELARRVGVARPSRIRIHVVETFPRPRDPQLHAVADHMGFFSAGMLGLTLGHAVLIAAGHEGSERLLRHEFRHVFQYEVAGSTVAFLGDYFGQLLDVGYLDAPLEIDARAHELEDHRAGPLPEQA